MNKLSTIMLLSFFLSACHQTNTTESKQTKANSNTSNPIIEELSLEDTFWQILAQQCGQKYIGKSSFPDNPNDSFYGKPLLADFASCSKTEIRVPFKVGQNDSRTWIFTKLKNGKLQLKHQHLHSDGSADEISNYGGVSDGGDIELSANYKTIHMHFPADSFTKTLIPEASTNIWTIEFIIDNASNKNAMTYNLYRHNKKRFIAELSLTE